MTRTGEAHGHGGHHVPRFLKSLGHRPPDHAEHRHDERSAGHGNQYAADNIDLQTLGERLDATRETLTRITLLTDAQLQTIPPEGSFRFCDGQRTLDQVLASLLNHQKHQVGALAAALA